MTRCKMVKTSPATAETAMIVMDMAGRLYNQFGRLNTRGTIRVVGLRRRRLLETSAQAVEGVGDFNCLAQRVHHLPGEIQLALQELIIVQRIVVRDDPSRDFGQRGQGT